METELMGRVTVEALIENIEDGWAARRGLMPDDQIRSIVVPDALVDTGATMLSLPTRLIQQLGLTRTSAASWSARPIALTRTRAPAPASTPKIPAPGARAANRAS